ncbi:hypothetical protein [Limnobacter sp.]|jgi:hypothetical protein|uniref:hypothetical protein n=1 Tax=Limnobacter sp. TaxID=2003368 RepID=UPI0027BACDAD|nr:hypothetical protein [Limnobacter sp.]
MEKPSKILDALIIGHNANLLRALPRLLARAGFQVDAITTSTQFKPAVPVRNLKVVCDKNELLAQAAVQVTRGYDLVVIGDDRALRDIVQSDLSDDIKLKLLPVCGTENFAHIGTKIGLSQLLVENGITTPDFWIVSDHDALVSFLELTPHTVMIKIDMSGGGAGVFKFEPGNNIDVLLQNQITFPVLVQRYIEGDLIDLSGVYQNGTLVHFSYSSLEEVLSNPFGVSSVRTYTQLGCVKESVFNDLRKLGRALGAHGFVNIACLRSAEDGNYYFVEADMRPTVWVEYSSYLGDDPARAIQDYFDVATELSFPQPLKKNYPLHMTIPYALRLSAIEVMTNRHQVWRFCEAFSKRDMIRHFGSGLMQSVKRTLAAYIKPRVSVRTWQRLRLRWK